MVLPRLHRSPEGPGIRIQTILIRVEEFKAFAYGEARLEERADGPASVVRMEPRGNGRPFRSGCGRRGPAYDRLEERPLAFGPVWGIVVFLAHRMRRVDRERGGVTVEMVPWCDGENRLTATCRWFLATRAKRLSGSEVASVTRTSWDSVRRAVGHAVEGGPAHRDPSGQTALGIDEVAWGRGQAYPTLVYDSGAGAWRLLAVTQERTDASWRACLGGLGESACGPVRQVCDAMWRPSLEVIGERLGGAVHVLGRFHVMQQLGRASDEIGAAEAERLERDGYEPAWKRSRGCFLKRPETLAAKQAVQLAAPLKSTLRAVRADLLREEFQRVWESQSGWRAGKSPGEWSVRVMRSRPEPMKKMARSIRVHRPLIPNRFRAWGRESAGAVEGLDKRRER